MAIAKEKVAPHIKTAVSNDARVMVEQTPNVKTLPRLLTAEQLAEITQINVKTLANQRVKGVGFPFLKIGGAIRYDYDVVSAFLENCQKNSTSQM